MLHLPYYCFFSIKNITLYVLMDNMPEWSPIRSVISTRGKRRAVFTSNYYRQDWTTRTSIANLLPFRK